MASHRRSRSGEYVVLGCLYGPGTVLLLAAILLPGDGPHGNMIIGVGGVALLIVANAIMLLQLVPPKPPEPLDHPDDGAESVKASEH